MNPPTHADETNVRKPVVRFGVTLASILVAGGVRWLLDPVLGDKLPFFTFYFATIVSAWYGGFWPGVISLVLGIGAGAFFFCEPNYSFRINGIYNQYDALRFIGVGICVSLICETLLRSQLRSERRRDFLRMTLACIGDAVITTDTEARITMMNAVAESLTGWTKVDAIGQPLTMVFNIINENSPQPIENPATVALLEGRRCGLANHTILIAKDKTERLIDDSVAPIHDGETFGYVLVFRDVTERRLLEKQNVEQVEAARKLAAIVDSSTDAIISKTLEGGIQSWNAAAERIFGYTANEALGRPITMLFPSDRLDEEEEIITRIRFGERVEHFDTVRLRKDGTLVPISLTISPIKNREGQVVGASKIARDITERKVLENELRQIAANLSEANRRKDEFMATLAHELRNPLAPIRNSLQIMKMARVDPSAIEQSHTIIGRQVEQMVRLVDDLMDMSRINQDKIELKKERIPLSVGVNTAVETSRPLIDLMGHELTVKLPENPIIVDADPIRLGQILTNILNNAAKYTERGGHIWLTVERQGGDAVISVRDTGVGLPSDKLTRIFDMFAQIDRSLEKSQGGLGIGLTLVKRLVEMHGGKIVAKSDGPGKGSDFVVRLPVVVEVSSPPFTVPEQPMIFKSSLHILIVDDNKDGADSLAMMLRIMGNDTRTAYDGVAGVALADELHPNVILFDIGMPKLNGYEACRLIRRKSWGKNVVMIAITGWGSEDDRHRSHDAGFDHHMVKPVNADVLMRLITELDILKR